MVRLMRPLTGATVTVLIVLSTATLGQVSSSTSAQADVVRAALPPGSINNVVVIDLENENEASTFGPGSVATYLNNTLVPEGELLENYYAIGHVSLDNYIAQVSGQAPTPLTDSDCDLGEYVNVTPGTDDANNATFPGQVDGNGCVFPAPTATSHGAPTIADQLDAVYPPDPSTHVASWREYAEDMGNDPTRDGGTADPLGGTDCAHPSVGGTDNAEFAESSDQYATRHNPFVYFHSIIDNTAECNANVVPLGTVAVGTPSSFNGTSLPDTFSGHLADDLSSTATTPRFAFITPNLCDDGHDATCTGDNLQGGHTGGLAGADMWLQHYMPLIMASPSYQSGQMLVVVTSDEGAITDTSACCNEQPGPNWAYPGFSPLLGTPTGPAPGGGRIGALLLNSKYIQPGTVDTTGYYNHYSALRSYEDLLGLTSGGTDGYGHIGFAAAAGVTPFGQDIFQPDAAPTIATNPSSQSAPSGATLSFTAAANIATPNAQWQVSVDGGSSWINIQNATSNTYTTGALSTFENGWEVRAVLTNHVGSATTNPATITVAPNTSVALPVAGATVIGGQYLDASASPGVTKVQYELTGGTLNDAVIATATPTIVGWLAGWDSTAIPNGPYTLQSVASYAGGGTGISPGVTITVNNSPPNTDVGLPAAGATVSGTQYLDAGASPGVTKVQYELTGGALNDAVIATATPTIVGWLAGWNSTSVPNGPYTLESVASYTGGVTGVSPGVTIIVAN
jgi:phosphatidylinositol-3-phosphatase